MMDFNKDYSDEYDEEVDSPSIDPDKEGNKPHRFKLVPFGEINLSTEPNYLIKGIVPRAGLTVIWGPPKCGKSFKCLDMFMSVARNTPYRDHKVKGGPVVYIALEGHRGFEARMEGYRQHGMGGNTDSVQFYLVGGTLDLVKDHAELIACIQAQIGDAPPAAVVIDTLNRSLSGSRIIRHRHVGIYQGRRRDPGRLCVRGGNRPPLRPRYYPAARPYELVRCGRLYDLS